MIIFENPGVIDERSIKMFGVSVKETENPIGYFGTGLKYAIAILIRTGHRIEIVTGGKRLKFQPSEVQIRGKHFSAITMNGEELPFTTELGKNWVVWQAFRELYCNALDEKGTVYRGTSMEGFRNENTYVLVDGHDFDECFDQRDNIVLKVGEELRLTSGWGVQIYDRPSKSIYYRGVRVMDLESPALYTYNLISDMELTEDRTLKYSTLISNRLVTSIARMTDRPAIRRILCADKSSYESLFEYSTLGFFGKETSDEFKEVLAEEWNRNNDRLNESAKQFHKKISKEAYDKNLEEAVLSPVQKFQLEKCTAVLKRVFPDCEYQILVVKTLGVNTMARADFDNQRMILSLLAFEKGNKYLLSTMIEEYLHLKTTYHDLTREFQTAIFDLLCGVIENHVLEAPV